MPLTTVDPAPALVVIDLQQGIVSGTVAHVVPRAAALAKAFRRHDLPVVLVNVTGRAPGRTDAGGHSGTSTSLGTLPVGWADIIDELDRQPGDYLITSQPHAPRTTTATTSCSPRTRWPTPTRTLTGIALSACSPSSARRRPAPRSSTSSTARRAA
jgi:hypothetical protein